MLSIGDTAQDTGLSVDALRYYEKIGLLPNIARDSGGRRCYGPGDLARLRFVQRAQRCDFSLDEIRQLLEFRDCRDVARPAVARLTEQKLDDIQHRLADLAQLQQQLKQLLQLCEGSDQGCPIIEGLDEPGEGRGHALKKVLDLESTPARRVRRKQSHKAGARPGRLQEHTLQTTTLDIDGMHCNGCVQIVQHLLEQTPGVKGAKVSLDSKQARIAHEADQVSADSLVEVVRRAGYTAVPAG